MRYQQERRSFLNQCDICIALVTYVGRLVLMRNNTSDSLLGFMVEYLLSKAPSVIRVPGRMASLDLMRSQLLYWNPREVCELNFFCPKENERQQRSTKRIDENPIVSSLYEIITLIEKQPVELTLITGKDCDLLPLEARKECYQVLESYKNDTIKGPRRSKRKLGDIWKDYGLPLRSRTRSLLSKMSLVRKFMFLFFHYINFYYNISI